MRITLFTNSPNKRILTQGSTWYITTKCRTILFVLGNSGNFWKEAEERGICVSDIDMIFLPKSCRDPIRELEGFLMHNQKAIIYLPRISNEKYFNELCCKFIGYKYLAQIHNWKERIVFMDDSTQINDEVQIFSGRTIEKGKRTQSQNMILSEDGVQVLFTNGKQYMAETVQKEAERISGNNINYMFYQNDCHEDMRKNCITEEMCEVSTGQSMVIGEDVPSSI